MFIARNARSSCAVKRSGIQVECEALPLVPLLLTASFSPIPRGYKYLTPDGVAVVGPGGPRRIRSSKTRKQLVAFGLQLIIINTRFFCSANIACLSRALLCFVINI